LNDKSIKTRIEMALLKFFRHRYFKTGVKIVLISGLVFCALFLFNNFSRFAKNGVAVNLSNTLFFKEGKSGVPRILPLKIPDRTTSLVSFRHDPTAYYGNAPPYEQIANPAYQLVWRAIEDLGLGSASSPLAGFVNSSDTVLIKPNLLGEKQGMYTHPSIVRPLIDMCVRAGAKVILVGDGGPGYTGTEAVMRETGYKDMVEKLRDVYPGVLIRTVNLNDPRAWHWVNTGKASMFYGSGYTDEDLADAMGHSLSHSPYYARKDPQGKSPAGRVMGWYAISDYVLNATVIINVAKMKCHDYMINTLCLKNNVGVTLSSTIPEIEVATWRIPHVKSRQDFDPSQYETNFGNDIFWRAIADVNRIVLYADRNGILKEKKQRRCLNVIDAIEASEVNQYGTGMGGGKIYRGQVLFAGLDPVAVDSVASRFMGFNWKRIPVIAKASSVPEGKREAKSYTLGRSDPSCIRITGDIMDSRFNHIFEHSSNWHQYVEKERLDIIDFDPPAVHSVEAKATGDRITITCHITGASVAFLYYEVFGEGYAKKMQKKGSIYTAVIPKTDLDYIIQAQDIYFNTVRTPLYHISSD